VRGSSPRRASTNPTSGPGMEGVQSVLWWRAKGGRALLGQAARLSECYSDSHQACLPELRGSSILIYSDSCFSTVEWMYCPAPHGLAVSFILGRLLAVVSVGSMESETRLPAEDITMAAC
jgi:hypothetical protein